LFSCFNIFTNLTNIQAAQDPPQGSNSVFDLKLIHDITQYLSWRINQSYNTSELAKGRYFGSNGEHEAAVYLASKMQQIGLWSHLEKIADENLNRTLNVTAREIIIDGTPIKDCYISPRYNNYSNPQPCLNFSLSYDNLSVYLKPDFLQYNATFDNTSYIIDLLAGIENGTINDTESFLDFSETEFEKMWDFSFEDFNRSDPDTYPSFFNRVIPLPPCDGPFLFIEVDPNYNPNDTLPLWVRTIFPYPLDIPRVGFKSSFRQRIQTKLWYKCWPDQCVGLIRVDFNNRTFDMSPNGAYAIPVLYLNGSVGNPILNSTITNGTATQHISYRLNQSFDYAESYNVIGQINGTDKNTTTIIGCLYDSLWNSGTADAAIGVGMMLANAKYIKENDIIPSNTLKFIAYGGEETGLLGAYYYDENHSNENITTVIDLNQLGFSQTGPLPQTFFIATNKIAEKGKLRLISNISHYCERSGTPYIDIGWLPKGGPSDVHAFYKRWHDNS